MEENDEKKWIKLHDVFLYFILLTPIIFSFLQHSYILSNRKHDKDYDWVDDNKENSFLFFLAMTYVGNIDGAIKHHDYGVCYMLNADDDDDDYDIWARSKRRVKIKIIM